jgi:hypothetical protein
MRVRDDKQESELRGPSAVDERLPSGGGYNIVKNGAHSFLRPVNCQARIGTSAGRRSARAVDKSETGAAANIAIVTPVLDDWPAFARLLQDISSSLADLPLSIEIVGVDDGSSTPFDPQALVVPADIIQSIEIIRLGVNLGHQRAIAVGLTSLADREDLDGVFVMDCDGEDRPADLPKLLAASRDQPGHIIVARRAQRCERRSFKIGYGVYKLLFKLLTGRSICFGNFSFMPAACVRRLVFMPEIWNNLPAAILRSRIEHVPVATARGRRYFGRSRMNWIGLVAHGLSAMSVYIDVAFVRILFGAAIVAAMTLFGIATAVAIRFTTTLAIPGWTTTVVGVLWLFLMQIAVMMVAIVLLSLAARNGRPMVPIADAGVFITALQRYELHTPSSVPAECEETGDNELLLSGLRT